MYRDSKLGICIDLTGPDGNVFSLMGYGAQLARRMGNEADWREACDAVKAMHGSYITMLHVFEEFFPSVTLIGKERYISNGDEEE
jgi:hypothetical protein